MTERRAKIGLKATITKHNVEHQKDAIDFFFDNYGIDLFWVDPIFPPVFNVTEKIYEPVDIMKFAATFIEAHEHAWKRNIFYESNLTTNFDGETDKACYACLPMPNLTVDGYLSACEMATNGKDVGKMDPMIYARYDDESDTIIYDEEKLKVLRSRTLSSMPAVCQTCIANKHCAGFCLGETLNETGSLFEIKTTVCPAICHIYESIGHLYPQRFGGAGFPYRHP
jgi:radical SAM protein with 4Fe4S-binding SPASM domain